MTGAFGDWKKPFTFTINVSDMTSTDQFEYTKYSTTDGINWVEISGAGGTIDSEHKTFTLTHNQKIEIEGLPKDKTITVSEQNGYYSTAWELTVDSEQTSGEGASMEFTLPDDGTLVVTNNLEPVAPTDYRSSVMPYLILLLSGAVLILMSRKRKMKN